MAAPKANYCPYKEYWFGPGEEPQTKPAGFRFKRGTLLKLRPEYQTSQYQTLEAGVVLEGAAIVPRLPLQHILLLLNYDSNLVKHRVFDPLDRHPQYVEATEHKFTFLVGEKMETVTLTVWGKYYTSRHNEMWIKARKIRTHPAKKPKKRGKGFSFDEI